MRPGDDTHHSRAEAHEEVLEVPPGRLAHGLGVRAGVLGEAGDELSVALTQLVATPASSAAVPH